jgi:hypothetical protein
MNTDSNWQAVKAIQCMNKERKERKKERKKETINTILKCHSSPLITLK